MRLVRSHLSKDGLCRESNKSAEMGRQEMVAFRRIFAHAKVMLCDIIRYSKPVGEHYDRPREKRGGSIKNPALYCWQQILNDKKFYWQGTNQKSDPCCKLLAPACTSNGAAFPASQFFVRGDTVWGLAQRKFMPSRLNAAPTNRTVNGA